jgi:hypothetical protein
MTKLRSIFCSFQVDDTDMGDETDSESECNKQYMPTFPCCQQPCPPPQKDERIQKQIKQLLHKSKLLRVIRLEGLDIGDKLPDLIGNVKHLQYLGITS